MFHPVKKPKHYAGDGVIACKDAMKSMLSGSEEKLKAFQIYWWGCAFKYLWRWPWKNGAQDIEKCEQCLKYLKEEIENGSVSGDQG